MADKTYRENMDGLIVSGENKYNLHGINNIVDLEPLIRASESEKHLHGLVMWYFTRNEAKRLIIPMDNRPTIPKEKYIEKMEARLNKSYRELIALSRGVTLPFPHHIVPNVVYNITYSYLDEWYEKEEKHTDTMNSDPKWIDRCEKIAHTMWLDSQRNIRSPYHRVLVFNDVGIIGLYNPSFSEGIQVCFYNKRSVTYLKIEDKQKVTPLYAISGSVSGTTLKSMREAVAKIKTMTKDGHILAVCDLLIKTI